METTERRDTFSLGFADAYAGLKLWRVWLFMAWMDIKLKYRRTVLGPLWVPATFVLTVLIMGFIWATIFHTPMPDYVPYLGCGLCLWFFLSSLLAEGPITFVAAKPLAQQSNLPLTFHVYRKVAYMALNFLHNVISFGAIALWYRVPLKASAFSAIPGFAMLLLFSVWMTLFVAAICLRYRDLTQAIVIAIGLLPLITPIYYKAEMLNNVAWVYEFNPLYHILEVCRAPLLGMPVPVESWKAVIGINVIGVVVALVFFARVRPRLAYWM